MNVLLTSSRTAVVRLLSLAAIIVVLLDGGQASAATDQLTPFNADDFAVSVLQSVESYWEPLLAAAGRPRWTFQKGIVDGADSVASPCGLIGDPDVVADAFPAGYCSVDNAVYLSVQWLYNHTSNNGTTPYGFAQTIAHEVGHAVQMGLGLPDPIEVKESELQADCFGGMWVAQQVHDGAATEKDWRDARNSAQTVGDYEFGDPGHHGTADERVAAWMIGFTGGDCLALNPPAGS